MRFSTASGCRGTRNRFARGHPLGDNLARERFSRTHDARAERSSEPADARISKEWEYRLALLNALEHRIGLLGGNDNRLNRDRHEALDNGEELLWNALRARGIGDDESHERGKRRDGVGQVTAWARTATPCLSLSM